MWRGGLALHGGLLGGFAAGLWLCRRRRLDPSVLADTVAPALILGQGIGRLGCLLSGDSYGTATTRPWAVTLNRLARWNLHHREHVRLGLGSGVVVMGFAILVTV